MKFGGPNATRRFECRTELSTPRFGLLVLGLPESDGDTSDHFSNRCLDSRSHHRLRISLTRVPVADHFHLPGMRRVHEGYR